ncbi:hypothetical protein Cpir12675_001409 [Ceratocystis pirilliformis]|uniref:C2H2-type domain-containing protein n=1 Tax=Ceratocystis pirilliformis TaxID=259994 RepID=A0ABR3ZF93_9PEZI
MLRIKLRGLEQYMERNGIRQITELSEAEEARMLQYRCEVFQSAIMEHGINIADISFVESLKHQPAHDSPSDYGTWLAQNMRENDTMARSARMGDYASQRQLRFSSFKCSNETCIYYVYGFATADDRDRHVKEYHVPSIKRDSTLSLGTPTLPFPDYGPSSSRSVPDSRHPTSLKAPGKLQSGPQLPPLNIGSSSAYEPRHRSTTSAHPPHNDFSALRGGHDDESASDLASSKNCRRTPTSGTVEAGGDIKYMQEIGPCLRCKLTNKNCDLADPCTSCANPAPNLEEDYWRSIGCLRVNSSLGCLAVKMLPNWLSNKQTRSIVVAPDQEQSHALHDYFERMYRAPSPIIENVLAGLDWKDSFWLTEIISNPPPGVIIAPLKIQAPQIFTILLNSQNAHAGSYNFLDVLRCSQNLSGSRSEEQKTLPVLYNAKVLLRQTLFFDLLQQEPVIVPVDRESQPHTLGLPEAVDSERYLKLVYDALVSFFESFQQMTMHKGPLTARDWFAGFFSICLFSIVKYILVERVEQGSAAPGRIPAWRSTLSPKTVGEVQSINDIYTAIVTIFVRSSPIIQEDGRVSMDTVDGRIMGRIDAIMLRGEWHSQGIRSIADFLYNLGSRNADSFGFVRAPSPTNSFRSACPPSAKPAEAQRPDSFRPWLTSASSNVESGEPGRSGHDAYVESPKTFDSPRSSRIRSESLYSKGAESPLRHVGFQRPPYRKIRCEKCNEYPEGFRSDSEYRRHFEAKHGAYRKAWMCVEPSNILPDMVKPTNPIHSCRLCHKRHFKSYQSAVIHLQRHHFTTYTLGRQRVGGSSSEIVPEHLLKDWIVETRCISESGDADDLDEIMDPDTPNTKQQPYQSHAPFSASLPPSAQGPLSAPHVTESQKPIFPPRSHSHGYPFPPRQPSGESSSNSAPSHLSRYESPSTLLPPPRQSQAPPQHAPSQQPQEPLHSGGIQLPPLNATLPPLQPPPAAPSHSSSYHSDSTYSSQGGPSSHVTTQTSLSPALYSQHHPGHSHSHAHSHSHSHSHSAHYIQQPPPLQTKFGPQESPSLVYPHSGQSVPPSPFNGAPLLQQSLPPTPSDAMPQPRVIGPPPAQYQSQPARSGLNLLQPSLGGMVSHDEPPCELPKTPENRSRCPFPDCGRVFKDITSHMLTHQEQRPEKCPIESCEYHTKGFARKYDKNRHALTHYKGTMICPFCPGAGTGFEKAFNRADVFKRHLTSIHHVEQAPPNSRRPISGGSRPLSNNHSTVNTEAQCSICHGRFTTAQEFYEHLDECVLNEIVPGSQSPKSITPTASVGISVVPRESFIGRGSRDWSDTQSVHSQGSVKGKGKLKEKKRP